MAVRIRIKIGDVFGIPLPDGRYAYCQYLLRKEDFGDLARVFDLLSDTPVLSVEAFKARGLLFPPIFLGLLVPLRHGRWKRIGNLLVENFEFPRFRQSMRTKPGVYDDWRVWDGKKEKKIGKLPESLRALELRCVWGDEALEERIMDGTYRGDRMF